MIGPNKKGIYQKTSWLFLVLRVENPKKRLRHFQL